MKFEAFKYVLRHRANGRPNTDLIKWVWVMYMKGDMQEMQKLIEDDHVFDKRLYEKRHKVAPVAQR